MTQNCWMPDYLLESVLCCPRCGQWPLQVFPSGLLCQKCRWQSELVGGDTLSFAPVVYDSARNQTKRARQSDSTHISKMTGLRKIHQKLIPWHQWVFRDAAYWRNAIEPLRQRELQVARNLLAEIKHESRGVLFELGVGFQDHLAFHKSLTDYAICSDIYRDPVAVQIYKDIRQALYCLINVDHLPLQNSSIDFIFTSHVVEHFPDRVQNLRALHRVLKPGAFACHAVPIASGFLLGHVVGTIANAITLTPRLGRGVHGEYDSWWQEIRHTTVRAWTNLFEECGFEMLSNAPGTLGLTPLRPSVALWLSDHLHIYGSWIFLMRAMK